MKLRVFAIHPFNCFPPPTKEGVKIKETPTAILLLRLIANKPHQNFAKISGERATRR